MSRIATALLCVLIAVASTATSVGHAAEHFDLELAERGHGHHHDVDAHDDHDPNGDEDDEPYAPTGGHAAEYHAAALIVEPPLLPEVARIHPRSLPEDLALSARHGFGDPDPD
ncbi:hypothetical protein [Parvularcula bermudensis]|nr:hypothetical protein [Parvularcula bermudensis]